MEILSILLSSEYDGLAKIMAGVIIGLIIGVYYIIKNIVQEKKDKKPDFEEVSKKDQDKLSKDE